MIGMPQSWGFYGGAGFGNFMRNMSPFYSGGRGGLSGFQNRLSQYSPDCGLCLLDYGDRHICRCAQLLEEMQYLQHTQPHLMQDYQRMASMGCDCPDCIIPTTPYSGFGGHDPYGGGYGTIPGYGCGGGRYLDMLRAPNLSGRRGNGLPQHFGQLTSRSQRGLGGFGVDMRQITPGRGGRGRL